VRERSTTDSSIKSSFIPEAPSAKALGKLRRVSVPFPHAVLVDRRSDGTDRRRVRGFLTLEDRVGLVHCDE
jgi:hypothetical protein